MLYSRAVGIDQNVLSAICIGGIIALMSMVKSVKLKALVFSLPISITTALIATGVTISALNVIGLLLLCLFLWLVLTLHKKGVPILIADIMGAGGYLLVGFCMISFIQLSFFQACLLYFLAWLGFMIWHDNRRHKKEVAEKSSVNPAVKITLVSLLAYLLLSAKSLLVGIIVTFPFAAVFAVIEGRRTIYTLTTTFCKNSIAILAFFIAVYGLQNFNVAIKIGLGWGLYVLTLWLVAKLPKLKLPAFSPRPIPEEDVAS